MRRDDNRRSEPVERREQVKEPLCHFGIDVACRLIRDEELGPVDHGSRDRHALLLTAGQGRRPSACPVGKTDPGQHLANRPFRFFLARSRDAQRQRDIVESRQVPDQPEVLEHHADAAAESGQLLARRIGQLLAKQADAAARRALRQIK